MGYDGLCTDETKHDPFFPLVLAAQATSRVTLETQVAIAFPRSPMVVAYAARDLQELSAGRFRLGLGTQVKGHNERRFSVAWASPSRRLREYVQSLRAIWSAWRKGSKLDFQSQFYSFTLMTPYFDPGPGSQSEPPVYVSAINPYNCRVAGEVCDGLAVHPLTSPKYLREVILPNVAKGAIKAGRDPGDVKLNGAGFIVTGPDKKTIDERKEVVRRRIAFYASTRTYSPILKVHGLEELGPRLHQMSLRGEWEAMAGLIGDDMVDTFAVVGGYDEVAGKVKERFGGLLDEVLFNMEASSPARRRALEKVIEGLHA